MFLNSWSLSLSLCSLLVLVLLTLAGRTALRVLLAWDPASDSEGQIRLENEIWLASTLVAHALGFQIISLVLLVAAADHYCKIIVGAMCATGALLANPYGMPTLAVKLMGVFVYGFWIVLHKLDISSEKYPLVRVKCVYLLLLLPLLIADGLLQSLYINGLKPDIITSCCAVIFSSQAESGQNLFGGMQPETLLPVYFGAAVLLAALGIRCYKKMTSILIWGYATAWVCFFILALVVITRVLSSYVYAMPYHNCPFCLFKPEYHSIGYAIFGTLIIGSFSGTAPAIFQSLARSGDLAATLFRWQRLWVRISLLFLGLFLALSSYHYVIYQLHGGEI